MLSFGVGRVRFDGKLSIHMSYVICHTYVIVPNEYALSFDGCSTSPKKTAETAPIERWTVSQLAQWLAGCPQSKVALLLQFSNFTLPPFHEKHAHVPAAHSYYLMFPGSKWRKLRFLADLLKLYSTALRHKKSQSPWTLEFDREHCTK